MDSAPGGQTSTTLLGRLRHEPADQAAWGQFVERYGPLVYAWCRQWRLQEADAEDVTQAVLLKLAARMRTFAYDPAGSFRGWLRGLARHTWSDFVAGRRRPGRGSGDSAVADVLNTVAARDDLVTHLEAQFDREVLEEAGVRVRQRVTPRSWEAFQLTAVDGLSGAEAGRRLGMQVAAVFKARSRVQQLLTDEVRRLDGDGE